jgi:DNA polymerase elongation subunit (family B)
MFKQKEVVDFLISKPGYIKKGTKALRKIIKKRGFKVSEQTCRLALQEVRDRLKNKPTLKNKPKVLFYDIEVSFGIFTVWNPGWKINVSYDNMIEKPKIICISYKWNDSDEVHTVRWDSNQNDKLLVENFVPVLNEADVIVAHNGDKFDLPWIKTRALYHNISMLPKYPSVDTLKISRYKFRQPSNRLDDIADYFGLGRKIKVGYDLWKDVVLKKSKEALNQMIEYCEQDVIVLEKVYNKLTKFELPTLHNGVLQETSKLCSPYSGGTNIELVKTTSTKAGTIKHMMICKDSNRYFEMSNTIYNKFKQLKNE